MGRCATSFAMIASRARCNEVPPDVGAPEAARDDVIDSRLRCVPPAVLANIIVPAEYFRFIQLNARAWAFDHLIQPDDGWAGE